MQKLSLQKNRRQVVTNKGLNSTFKSCLRCPNLLLLSLPLICAVTILSSPAHAGVTGTYDGSTVTGGWEFRNFSIGRTLSAKLPNFNNNTITVTGNVTGFIIGNFTSTPNASITGNIINVQNGAVSQWTIAGWSSRGGTSGNQVNFGITGSTPSTLGIVAGLSQGAGSSTGNSVRIYSGTVNGQSIAGYSEGGNAVNNSMLLTGGEVTGNTVAGWAVSGTASGNSLRIEAGSESVSSFAGFTNTGSAIGNSVVMTGGEVTNVLAAGYSHGGNSISNNTILVTGGEITTAAGSLPNLAAGFSEGGATVENNITTIEGGEFTGAIVGGFGKTGSVTGNVINISGGTAIFTATPIIAGGYTDTGVASGNTANIRGGDFVAGSIIAGGYSSGAGSVTGNTIYVGGGTFGAGSTIAAGYSAGAGSVTGNTMIIDNPTDLTLASVGLKGGVSTGGTVADNRLVIKSKVEVDSVSGFEHLEFHIQKHDSDAMLKTTTPDGINLTATKNVEVYIGDRLERLRTGDQIKLFRDDSGITGTANNVRITAAQGFHVLYDLEYQVSSGGANRYLAVTNARAHPHSRSFIEGRLASFAFMSQGTDLVAGQGIASALTAANTDSRKWAAFSAFSVGTSKYDTGGEAFGQVNFSGFSMLTGLSKVIDINQDDMLVGAFFELGRGDIDTFNSFKDATEITSLGESTYYGGGVLARYNHNSGFYGEGFIRAGGLDTEYNTNDIRFSVQHEGNATYYGGGTGFGYQFENVIGADIVELYGRYSWLRMQAEDTVIDSTDYQFDTIDSHQIRLGARYDYRPEFLSPYSPYIGVAWEHEFSADAEGTVRGDLNLTTPNLKGSSGIFEIGVRIMPNPNIPVALSFDIEGYVGGREGMAGNLELIYTF